MDFFEKSTPLDGLKVIDLSTAVAAPMCGRLLADMGADVIKVETPSIDINRALGNVYNVPSTPESNPFHATANSNKRIITMDLRSDAGKEILHRLLEDADVLLTSFRVKAQEILGVSYEQLKEKYPRLIFVHFSGFGSEGHEAERPGYDVAAFWGRSGALVDWVQPGTLPITPGLGTGDTISGTVLFSGVLAALYAREKTGKGTLVSSSLLGSGIWANGNYIFITQPGYDYQAPADPAKATNPFFNSYQCKDDEWITVVMPGPITPIWEKACKAFGMEEYLEDPRFGTDENVIKHNSQEILYGLVTDIIRKKTFAEWKERLLSLEVVHEKAYHCSEVTSDEQALANGYIENVVLPDGKEARYPASPIRFSEYKTKPVRADVNVGQYTEEILKQLGYTDERIKEMYDNKSVL